MKGKAAIVTGAAQGIGKETALHLARAGIDVCIGDINYDLACEVKKEIEALGVRALVVEVDTSEYAQVEQMIQKTVKTFGRLDILVNNAAFVVKTPCLDYTEEMWNRIIGVTINGYFYCAQLAARAMVEKDIQGKIINISSVVGLIPHGGLLAYSVAKAGVLTMTKLMSHELRKKGITVNAVVPALTDTPLMSGIMGKIETGKMPKLPMGAVSTSADVAEVIMHIVTDTKNMLNGNHLSVGSAAIGG